MRRMMQAQSCLCPLLFEFFTRKVMISKVNRKSILYWEKSLPDTGGGFRKGISTARQPLFGKLMPLNSRQNFLHRRQATDPFIATRKAALRGLDEMTAILPELADIALSGRVEPHFPIHRRGDQHAGGAGKREINSRQGIWSQPIGKMAQNIGAGRSDEEKIRMVRQINVPRFPGLFLVLQRDQYRMARKRL